MKPNNNAFQIIVNIAHMIIATNHYDFFSFWVLVESVGHLDFVSFSVQRLQDILTIMVYIILKY